MKKLTGLKNNNWFQKIKLDAVEETDGSLSLTFEWDENDTDLKVWTSWKPEEKENFILTAIRNLASEE